MITIPCVVNIRTPLVVVAVVVVANEYWYRQTPKTHGVLYIRYDIYFSASGCAYEPAAGSQVPFEKRGKPNRATEYVLRCETISTISSRHQIVFIEIQLYGRCTRRRTILYFMGIPFQKWFECRFCTFSRRAFVVEAHKIESRTGVSHCNNSC